MVRVCWICHSECAFEDNVLNQKNQSPCYCKGSLESVHRECLNQWVTKRYKKILNEIKAMDIQLINEDDLNNPDHPVTKKLMIHCPNCKYPLKYEVIELPQEYNLKSIFSHNRKEKVILTVMIIFQIGLLALEYYKNENSPTDYTEEVDCDLNLEGIDGEQCCFSSPEANSKSSYSILNIVYVFTVFVILTAAGYNIFYDSSINFGIQVKDKDYQENIPLYLRQSTKE